MVNRRRSREPTGPDRPIMRSIMHQVEERAWKKPYLSNIGHEYKTTPPRKTHRGTTHDELPHKPRGLSLYTMAFSYPRFNGETDAATHVRLFLNVWNANHMAQRLPEEEAHQSKMTVFGLTLDGTHKWICQQSKLLTCYNRPSCSSSTRKFRNT